MSRLRLRRRPKGRTAVHPAISFTSRKRAVSCRLRPPTPKLCWRTQRASKRPCTRRCVGASRRPTKARPSGAATLLHPLLGTPARWLTKACPAALGGCSGGWCACHAAATVRPRIRPATRSPVRPRNAMEHTGLDASSITLARSRASSMRCTAGGRCRPAPRRPPKRMQWTRACQVRGAAPSAALARQGSKVLRHPCSRQLRHLASVWAVALVERREGGGTRSTSVARCPHRLDLWDPVPCSSRGGTAG